MSWLGDIGDVVGIGTTGIPWGSIVSAGSALLSSSGQSDTNEQNARIAQQAGEFNADEAQKNRDFQERLSGSAYQRATADMKAAGLNPMLAYSQGGAGTPGGGQAARPVATMQNSAAAGITAGLQSAQLQATNAQTLNTNAQTENIKADTDIKNSEMPWKWEDGKLKHSTTSILKMEQGQESSNRQLNIATDTARINSVIKQIASQISLTEEETKKVTQTIVNLKAENKNINTNNVLLEAGIPAAKREAWAAGTTWGKYVTPFLPDLLKGSHSAGQIQRFSK